MVDAAASPALPPGDWEAALGALSSAPSWLKMRLLSSILISLVSEPGVLCSACNASSSGPWSEGEGPVLQTSSARPSRLRCRPNTALPASAAGKEPMLQLKFSPKLLSRSSRPRPRPDAPKPVAMCRASTDGSAGTPSLYWYRAPLMSMVRMSPFSSPRGPLRPISRNVPSRPGFSSGASSSAAGRSLPRSARSTRAWRMPSRSWPSMPSPV
mmetsp:Transcript_100169/g.323091  ORF Transcript_100169/g.323091 Transcript_100169/m.323091 type:complete len:212 (-) Transcript_100169:214-849(-)